MESFHAVYRSWAIPCGGTSVYGRRHRDEWLAQLVEPGVRIRAEHLYQQLDSLEPVRQAARRELLRESGKHAALKFALPDSCDRSDSLRPAGGHTADTPSLPY